MRKFVLLKVLNLMKQKRSKSCINAYPVPEMRTCIPVSFPIHNEITFANLWKQLVTFSTRADWKYSLAK